MAKKSILHYDTLHIHIYIIHTTPCLLHPTYTYYTFSSRLLAYSVEREDTTLYTQQTTQYIYHTLYYTTQHYTVYTTHCKPHTTLNTDHIKPSFHKPHFTLSPHNPQPTTLPLHTDTPAGRGGALAIPG